jgi:hypothetical protein
MATNQSNSDGHGFDAMGLPKQKKVSLNEEKASHEKDSLYGSSSGGAVSKLDDGTSTVGNGNGRPGQTGRKGRQEWGGYQGY